MKLDTYDELLVNNMNAYFYFLKNLDASDIVTYMQKNILDMLSHSDIPTISLFVNDLVKTMEVYFEENGLDDVYLSMAYAHKDAADIQMNAIAKSVFL